MSEKDELDNLLEQWQVTPASDPQLKHRVWTRIAAGSTRTNQRLPDWLTSFMSIISRPLGATGFVAASIVCGLFLAEMRVSKIKSVHTEELAKSYIQLIDVRTETTKPTAAK